MSPIETQNFERGSQDGDSATKKDSHVGLSKAEVLSTTVAAVGASSCFLEKVVHLSGLEGEESLLVRQDLSDVLSVNGSENENLTLEGLRSMMLKYLDLVDLEMRNNAQESSEKH